MYGSLTCPNLSLVEFQVRFVHAMESQRHHECKYGNSSFTSFPKLKTSYEIEKHARNIYAHTNFYVFQRQLYIGRIYCHVQGITNLEDDRIYEIKHSYENKMRIRYVVHNEHTSECRCSCHLFESDGIPCAHMLLVFTSNLLREISAAYIINRWTKMQQKHQCMNLKVFQEMLMENQPHKISSQAMRRLSFISVWIQMGEPRKVTAVAKFHDFSRASTSGHGWRVSE